jgi:folylpolyglutamate synthase/dihydropteroate synthase
MNVTQIAALKQTLKTATAAYESEKLRLIEAGMKSKDRYIALKTLKTAQDAANSAYVKFTHGQIKNELDKIIAAQTPEQRAESLRRARGV